MVSRKGKRYKQQKNRTFRKRRKICIEICLLLLAICFYLIYERSEYRIEDKFYHQKNYDGDTQAQLASIFKKKERKYLNEMDWAYKSVHMDIYNEVFGDDHEGINAYDIERYHDKIWNIYQEMPYKDDIKMDADYVNDKEEDEERVEEYENFYSTFNEAVKADISSWKPIDLWKAYKAGKELCKKNNTSEMVFQTGVLAEGAHENVYKERRGDNNTLLYLAGATESFDDFLSFNIRDSGEGVILSEVIVSFRQGKMDYREGIKEKEDGNPQARHFLLKTYEEFEYGRENTSIDDKNYLTYLYYSGLACLRLMPYIMDEELRSKICKKELSEWDSFLNYYHGSFGGQKVEDKTEDDIIAVRNKLMEYTVEEERE